MQNHRRKNSMQQPSPGAAAPFVFYPEAMASLQPAERWKFEIWGQGPQPPWTRTRPGSAATSWTW